MKFKNFNPKEYSDNKKIIIYGIGYIAANITIHCLEQLQIPIYAHADRRENCQIESRKKISLTELVNLYEKEDIIILWAVNGHARTEIAILQKRGIKQVYSVRNLWEDVDFFSICKDERFLDFYSERSKFFFIEDTIANSDKIYLYSLDIVVTEKCSLKCKDCSNLMQYYIHPKNFNIEEIKNRIDCMLDKVEHIYDLRILGGEPFMNKEFVRLIDAYKKESSITKISIFSNATIFPKEEILKHLKDEKVWMRFSDYGELSRQLDTWVEWCTKNKVNYIVSKMDIWHNCGKLERHDYCKEELWDIYGNCDCRNLPTMIENKLFNCPYAANAANLGAMKKNEMKKDFLIIDEEITPTQIDDFLYNREYLEACRYCNGRNNERARTKPFVQTKQPLEYKYMLDKKEDDVSEKIQKNQDILLSVIVPVYNVEEYIEECLVSILKQTYEKIELIIVDDGSTDNSLEICKRIQKEYEKKQIKIIVIKHGGVVSARNTGIEQATGEYITFVDGDDYLAKDRYENMVNAMGDCDIVNAGYIREYEEGVKEIPDSIFDRGQRRKELQKYFLPKGIYEGQQILIWWKYSFYNFLHKSISSALWSKLFKTSIVKKIYKEIDATIYMGEDVAFIHRYMLECKKIAVIEEYGYFYRIRNNRNRYNADNYLINYAKMYQYYKKIFKGHPYEQILMQGAEMNVSMGVRFALSEMFQTKNDDMYTRWYYPYYGRLKGKSVILYGAGKVGKAYYHHIINDTDCVLVAWVDKNAKYLKEEEMLPVQETSCINSYEYDCIIVAVNDEKIYMQICEELIKNGVDEKKIVWNATKCNSKLWME